MAIETWSPAPSLDVLLVIEGPHGVGKSTLVQELVPALRQRHHGREVHATREPSNTVLGAAIRALEPDLPAAALALACVADRLDHLDREILPAMDRGAIVVCDRYVPSSLVLQGLDGLPMEDMWRLNHGVRTPDCTIYLKANPNTIRGRGAGRVRRDRLDPSTSLETEIELYDDAQRFLSQRGWRQFQIDSESRSPSALASQVIRLLD